MAYTTINKSTDYFNTVTYTGDGNNGRTVTGVGFQPDLVWTKTRNQSYNHRLFDAVRGATKALFPDNSGAEGTESGLVSFDSDGFTVDSYIGNNGNGTTYASWNWLAANGTASNTDGSITSTVSANTTSGFSIVSFVGNQTSGATVGHGLGVAPKVVLIKGRDTSLEWRSYFSQIGAGKYMVLNENYAEATASNFMNDTAPTSSVFSLGNGATPNKNGENYIAYCFAEKTGFSKFGKFSGTTGEEFVYTGFKPAFVMLKRTNTTSDWYMFDNKRNSFNLSDKALDANTNDVEATYGSGLDLLSNGFVDRSFLADNGNELIYMAFAEAPLVGSNNVPCTAR